MPETQDDYDKNYQAFVDSVAHHCRCVNGPCDGVLAGGMCDGFDEDWYESQRRDDLGNDYDEEE